MTATANSIAWQILASITESTVSQEIPTISGNIEWQLRAAISNSPVGQLQLAIPAGNAAPEPVTAQADPDEEKTSAQGTPSPKPKPPRRQPLTEKRVLTTIEALATTSSLKPAVSLVDLRQALGADRAALDALLMSLLSQQKLTLTPASADQPLTEDETAASLLVDGQPHLLCALTTPPTTAAKSAVRRGRRQTESAD